jgi:hypothetical protein
MNTPTTTQRVVAHILGEDTDNDTPIDELYREAHGIADGRAVDRAEVERWAFETVNAVVKGGAA